MGDLYSSSVANPGFNVSLSPRFQSLLVTKAFFKWSASPACTELEVIVTDWAAKLLGLSPDFYNSSEVGGGVIQTTASDSVLVTVVAARSRYQRQHPDAKIEDLILYTTSQTHALGKKAALILGLQVRVLDVQSEDEYGLRGDSLRVSLEKDLASGLKPFMFSAYFSPSIALPSPNIGFSVATIGSTSSGAVDNLREIGTVRKWKESLLFCHSMLITHVAVKDFPDIWLHVDAAWAGVAFSCPEYREKLGLNEVNEFTTSFCTNFHKVKSFSLCCLRSTQIKIEV